MKSKEIKKVAIRYGKALLEAVSVSEYADLLKALKALAQAWDSSLELRNVILNPAISLADRTSVMCQLAKSESTSEKLKNLITILLENNRITALPEIAEVFERLVLAQQQTLSVQIISAYELSETEQSQVLAQISKECSNQPKVNWLVDNALIGGLVIKIGDKVLDNTVKGSIEKLRQDLIAI